MELLVQNCFYEFNSRCTYDICKQIISNWPNVSVTVEDNNINFRKYKSKLMLYEKYIIFCNYLSSIKVKAYILYNKNIEFIV